MSAHYPVQLEIAYPGQFSRAQLGLRVALFIVLGILGFSFGAAFAALYLGLPLVAAVALSNETSEQFHARAAPRIVTALRWIFAVYAYFVLLTDRLPIDDPRRELMFDVTPTSRPTVESALLRILLGIPSVLVLAIVVCVSTLAWLVAFVLVLIRGTYGRALFDFQVGVLRWMARLFAYQASLVEEYPPFALETTRSDPALRHI
jgi:hypothetical protein